MKFIFSAAVLIGVASAAFGWGSCSDQGKEATSASFPLDYAQFIGEWYELAYDNDYSVKNFLLNFGKDCVKDVYFYDEEQTLRHRQEFQLFWTIPWKTLDFQFYVSPNDNKQYSGYSLFDIFHEEMSIISTDYSHWAVAYGCQDFFGIFHFQWATLLSRTTSLEEQYIKAAKKVLRDQVLYDYDWNWIRLFGIRRKEKGCFNQDLTTWDEVTLQMLEKPPLWSDYEFGQVKDNNDRIRKLYMSDWERFYATNSLFADRYYTAPSGYLTGNITFNDLQLATPMTGYVTEIDYQKYFVLRNVLVYPPGYEGKMIDQDPAVPESTLKADIFFLSILRSVEQLETLEALSGRSDDICCFYQNPGFKEGDGQFEVKALIAGFGRQIFFNRVNGVIRLEEGVFSKGRPTMFGRFMAIENRGFFEYSFIGHYPSTLLPGKGIAIVDKSILREGLYSPIQAGEDFSMDPALVKNVSLPLTVRDFTQRTKTANDY